MGVAVLKVVSTVRTHNGLSERLVPNPGDFQGIVVLALALSRLDRHAAVIVSATAGAWTMHR